MKTLKQKIAELPQEQQDKIKVRSAQIINQYINKEKNIMEAIITLIIFTLILFSFVLGVLVGKLVLQPKLEEGTLASYEDLQRDFIDFTERN